MKIAVGNSRMDKKWKNQDISWADLCARCGSTIRTTETVEEYRKLKKSSESMSSTLCRSSQMGQSDSPVNRQFPVARLPSSSLYSYNL